MEMSGMLNSPPFARSCAATLFQTAIWTAAPVFSASTMRQNYPELAYRNALIPPPPIPLQADQS
jgi:hypothetical protein